MNYLFERELLIYHNKKVGFDYLPSNYESMSRHKQNNVYMVALWEQDYSMLEKAIEELEQLDNLETGICYNVTNGSKNPLIVKV